MFCLAVCAESLVAFLVQNIIASWNKIVAWIAGVLLMFIVYAQSLVLLFTGGYVQLIMLTNLESVEALQGRGSQYIVMIVITLLILFLPIDMDEDAEELLAEFYSDTVGDGIDKPRGLAGSPNVVLIFAEGLSMNVIEDPREIMPNVAYYMENGLSFQNYYDHTAATFRGLIGQLYSSHQYNNGDTNLLVSIQEVLSQRGYETTFVNPEPNMHLKVITSEMERPVCLTDSIIVIRLSESLWRSCMIRGLPGIRSLCLRPITLLMLMMSTYSRSIRRIPATMFSVIRCRSCSTMRELHLRLSMQAAVILWILLLPFWITSI